ncbi:MAG TPA: hypothetical protein VGO43_15655 [Pyrinomonadaceae bacterium]|nr:hypothetical protein [Pyrinomonadaceae bacterium]
MILLFLDVSPEIIATSRFATENVFASNLINSMFAAPSTGGEVSRIFKMPFVRPTTSLFDARGTTRTVISTDI